MPTDVLMPQLSPTMTEGKLSKWVKKEGDEVNIGTVIAEIETDKATMEVEATEDGILAKLLSDAGKDIAVGTPIAVITEEGEKLPTNYKPKAKVVSKKVEPKKEAIKPTPKVETPKVEMPKPQVQPIMADRSGKKSSPLARRLAAEWGIPLDNISGTGPHGRIIQADIENARANGVRKTVAGAAPSAASSPAKAEFVMQPLVNELVEHSTMRKVIAKRLVEAKQTVPHFYLTVDVMMAEALKARQTINAMAPVDGAGKPSYKLSVNDMIIKASALALRQHPNANASWMEEGLQKHGSVDIAVAVSIEGGLITPILHQADEKSLVELSQEIKDLAAKARAGKLTPEQYQGGTFSISNLGMYGIKHFDAIINPPQSCILACGMAEKRPVVNALGQVEATDVMTVTMSVDHRVVDGALGAELLQSIKKYLENPIAMVA